MTVPEQTPRASFTGDGAQDTYAFAFRLLEDDDLQVFVDTVLQTLNSDYTIENLTELGGDVVFDGGSIPGNGDSILLIRRTDRDQETVYNAFDPFPSAAHETALDKLTMQVQEVTEVSEGVEEEFADHVADGTIHFVESSIDHNNIQNNGANSHAAIDSHIGDGSIHFPFPQAELDAKLDLDAGNGPLTGPLGTQDIAPTGDGDNRDQGAEDNRYRRVFGKLGVFINSDNPLNVVLPGNADQGGILIGTQNGDGALLHEIGSGGQFASIGIIGNAKANQATKTAELISNQGGTFVLGQASVGGVAPGGTGTCRLSATGFAAWAMGYAYCFGDGTAQVLSPGSNTFAWGRAYAQSDGDAQLLSDGRVSFAIGAAQSRGAGGTGVLRSSGYGSWAQGYVDARASNDGFLEAVGNGSHASGYVDANAGNAGISASGVGSFAHGYVTAGENIEASAVNAVQFGVGVNDVANSLQVGQRSPTTGVRLLGDVGVVNARLGILLGGNALPVVSYPTNLNDGALLVGNQDGDGTVSHVLGDPFNSIALLGNVTAANVGQYAKIECSGGSAFCFGSAFASGPGTTQDAQLLSTGYGSWASGYAYSFSGGVSLVHAEASNSQVWGRAYSGVGTDATSLSKVSSGPSARASWVLGNNFCQGVGSQAIVYAEGPNNFCMGFAYAIDGYTATIQTDSINGASFAFGSVIASAYGSGGVGAEIRARGQGSFAFGVVSNSDGAYAYDQKTIEAIPNNSAQWFPGTNNQGNSLQVGQNIRLKGDDGPPTSALHNGDIWVENGFTYIRSNGISVQIT